MLRLTSLVPLCSGAARTQVQPLLAEVSVVTRPGFVAGSARLRTGKRGRLWSVLACCGLEACCWEAAEREVWSWWQKSQGWVPGGGCKRVLVIKEKKIAWKQILIILIIHLCCHNKIPLIRRFTEQQLISQFWRLGNLRSEQRQIKNLVESSSWSMKHPSLESPSWVLPFISYRPPSPIDLYHL